MNRVKIPILLSVFAVFSILIVSSCCKDVDDDDPIVPSGKLQIKFHFLENGIPVAFDSVWYTNQAGNPYLITEIKYFLSRVKLYNHSGSTKEINEYKFSHYVDNTIPTTLTWDVYDKIPVGNYDSLGFTFGFNQADNVSFIFINPPENAMEWPEPLGGGYHYMMLNGYYKNQSSQISSMNFHLGIGQTYDTSGNVTSFIHNNFYVSVPVSTFKIEDGKTTTIHLNMNVEEWFKNPSIFDFNVFGGSIMQNQDAMHTAALNGTDVFSFGE